MRRTASRSAFVLASLLFLAPAVLPATEPPLDLAGLVERVRREFDVPGVGLAVVKDGEVVVARAYGVRRLGEDAPCDARTRQLRFPRSPAAADRLRAAARVGSPDPLAPPGPRLER